MNRAPLKVRLQYFASLRERRGLSREELVTAAATPAGLYAELSGRHGFMLPAERVRVAVNGEFAEFSQPLKDGDEVAFIPPVAGG
ncbi:MAG TPA: molybdopterin converting factor subunit 1 [Opitutaceae bacterium]